MEGIGPGLALADATGKPRVSLAVLKSDPNLWLTDDKGKQRFAMILDSNGPNLRLSDDEGFETSIGSTDLVTPATGETHKTSAASLVMFDKEKNVIWRAP